jgi:serine/threonine-protein kinase HipA
MARRLAIWMNGLRVGYWTLAADGSLFEYDPAWVADEQGRAISLTMPFRPGNAPYSGPVVHNYFDNLLPDGDRIRRRIAARHALDPADPFAMLAALGRDCVGALQILDEDESPEGLFSIRAEPMSESEIAQHLNRLIDGTADLAEAPAWEDEFRLSIAGAQDKTALLMHEGEWCRPIGSTPTTHIFKLPMGVVGSRLDMSLSVENEWLCAKIVAAFGIPIAETQIARFDEVKALVVTRFDRRLSARGDWIIRLPQEDLCQALGVNSLDKYQASGGPGMADIMHVLANARDAVSDQRIFLKAQLVFWLLAAIDGHAKNFSIAHDPLGRFHLTPLYDVLSAHHLIAAHALPQRKAKLAMGVRGTSRYHYVLERIEARHWRYFAKEVLRVGFPVDELIAEVLAEVPVAIETALTTAQLEAGYPLTLAETICKGLAQQAEVLRREL